MARRKRRDREDDYDERDDRRDRRGGYPRGGGSGMTIAIIGAVVCVGLLAGTYVFVTQTGKSQRADSRRDRNQPTRRTQSQRQAVTDVSTGARAGSSGGSGGSTAQRAARKVDIRCVGRWVVHRPDKEKGLPDPRHLEALCPSCGGKVAYKADKCSCGQKLQWSKSIKCEFCEGDGKCRVCENDGLCPWCKKHPPRQMMGMVLDKCPMKCPNGKCPGCKGSKRCDKCEGTGRIELREDMFR